MKLEATITQVIEDGEELSITIRGWAETDPDGTMRRPLGTINIPADARSRKSYHVGRTLIIDIKPTR